jgi:tRNA A37 threonylcarbamoyladenosine dehydratase
MSVKLNQFSRTELAIGKEGVHALKNATVAVLGIGGVGSFTVEALARSGVGRLVLVDKDDVDITNVNRQIHALLSTVGQPKVDLMKARIADINPECDVIALKMFYTEETCEQFFSFNLDYVVDACDTVTYKIHIIKECKQRKIPVISSMGAANKMDPSRLRVGDISQTSYDPLARIIRKKLREARIHRGVKVVYSTEIPVMQKHDTLQEIVPNPNAKIRKAKMPPASNAFVPSVAGLLAAGEVINDLLKQHQIKVDRARNQTSG